MACLVGAAVAGLVVGMVAAVVAYTIGESSCPPEDDQCANGLLAGFGFGILAAAGATTISIFLLSLRARLGWTFAVGSAVAVGLLTAASILLQSGWSLPLSLLSALLLVTVTVLTHRRAAQSGDEGRWGS